MARQMYSSNELLTIPPPIVGTDVSARWKRTWKGEVVMTVIMPDDVVDTEVYVKTSKGHIGIQMDPWMSCSWKRNWSLTHPPNTQTKEKMRKYRLQRAGRRISLFRTAGRPRQMNNSHWSPRPEARSSTPYRRRTPSPTKSAVRKHNPSPSAQLQWTKNTTKGDWSDESTDSASEAEAAVYHKEAETPGKIQSTILSPESPPEYEKGLSSLDYVPKSPVYYPAGYSDGESEKDSLLDLDENWDEDNSSDGPKNPTPPEEEASQKDTSAEQKERSPTPQPNKNKTEDNLGNIYLDSDEVLLTKLTKIADTVNSQPSQPSRPSG